MPRAVPAALVTVLLAGTACASGGSARAQPAVAASSRPPAATTGSAPAAVVVPPVPAPAWRACSNGFECAALVVPLDYTRPGAGTTRLRLIRIRATDPARRVGSLVVNPGGPGVSAVDFLRQYATGSAPGPIRARFDLVAFDPRGTTGSRPVRCVPTAAFDQYVHVDPAPDTATEVAALVAANRAFDAGCAQRMGAFLAHVSTVDAARDMDSVRAALREPRLTYLGYSYGTALGAAYLDQFPTHVRAMVLDGALDPRSTWDELLAGQARGFDQAFASFLQWCEGHAATCRFRRDVPGDLGAAFDALSARVDAHAIAGNGARTVGPGEFAYGVGQALYSTSYWPFLGTALASAERGDGSLLLELSDLYLGRSATSYDSTIAANSAVNCLDKPWPGSTAAYQQLADRTRAYAPRFGPEIAWSGQSCASWPVPAVSRPHAVSGRGSPPILVIGTTRDPATPYRWAVGLAHQLAAGVLLTHVGDGHTAYRASAPACIVDPVDTYLITAARPAPARC